MKKETLEKIRKYYTPIIILEYLMPLLLTKDTGSGMLILLVVLPLLILIVSIFYSKKNGFIFLYPCIIGASWLPMIIIFNNTSIGIYSLNFLCASLVGEAIGNILRKLD